jgi:hypothetical protein
MIVSNQKMLSVNAASRNIKTSAFIITQSKLVMQGKAEASSPKGADNCGT